MIPLRIIFQFSWYGEFYFYVAYMNINGVAIQIHWREYFKSTWNLFQRHKYDLSNDILQEDNDKSMIWRFHLIFVQFVFEKVIVLPLQQEQY